MTKIFMHRLKDHLVFLNRHPQNAAMDCYARAARSRKVPSFSPEDADFHAQIEGSSREGFFSIDTPNAAMACFCARAALSRKVPSFTVFSCSRSRERSLRLLASQMPIVYISVVSGPNKPRIFISILVSRHD